MSGGQPAPLARHHAIEQFLRREARLLDEERLGEWLGLLTEDIRYWMPGVQARYRRDERGGVGVDRMAFFDDDLEYLRRRVARATHSSAWGEDPPTRHLHVVANVEVETTERADEWIAHSVVINIRARNEDEENWLSARRRDLIREEGGVLKLARREIRIQQSVLDAKNLNAFL